MCSYKILFHKASGYVVKCNDCSHYQVAFGTMVFTISTDNMFSLFAQVDKLKGKQIAPDTSHHTRIQIKLPCDSVIMALNMSELRDFHSMLEEAFVVEELKSMLYENNIS